MTQPATIAREIVVTTDLDPYLSLKALSGYCGLSVKTLQRFLQNAGDPLPHYRPGGGKVLVRRSEFDRWMSKYKSAEPAASGRDIARHVNAAMAKFGATS